MNIKNLLTETLEIITDNGHGESDVVEVAFSKSHKIDDIIAITWEQFKDYAKDTNYDSGYGAEHINTTLKIIGSDWWLERRTYDGAEWWVYMEMPKTVDITDDSDKYIKMLSEDNRFYSMYEEDDENLYNEYDEDYNIEKA